MNDELAGRVILRIHRKKPTRHGLRGRGKPWRGATEAEKRAAARLGCPPLNPVRPGRR